MPDPNTVSINVESVALDLNPDGSAASPATGNKLLGITLLAQPGQFPLPAWGTACVARPWTWTGVTWTVLGWNGAAWVAVGTGLSARPFPEQNDANWTTVMQQMMTSIQKTENVISSSSDLASSDQDGPRQITLDNNSFQGGKGESVSKVKKYVSLMANLASAPYPVPELLNLTFFLDLAGKNAAGQPLPAAGCTRFLALPSFTLNVNQNYNGNQQSWPAAQGQAWEVTVDDVTMHCEWSAPETGQLFDGSLWLPPAVPAQVNPLVNDWQSHIYELLGPYLDSVHVLTCPSFEPGYSDRLGTLFGKDVNKLLSFRACVLQELYNLIQTGAPPVAPYDSVAWTSRLRNQLEQSLPLPAALTNGTPASLADEVRDLRQIVGAATTGANLVALVKQAISTSGTKDAVPAYYLVADRASALLGVLQARLAIPYAGTIAGALQPPPVPPADVQGMLLVVFQNLLSGVVIQNLKQRLNASWVNYPAGLVEACFPVPDPLPVADPAANRAAATPGTGSASTALRADLFRIALGTTDPANEPSLTGNTSPLVLPAIHSRSAVNPTKEPEPLRGVRGVGVMLRRTSTAASGTFLGEPGSPWTSPNIAAPLTLQLDPMTNKMVMAGAPECPALVASRLMYNRDLLTGSLLYNNGPLACANLLHGYMAEGDRLQHRPVDNGTGGPATPVDTTQIPLSALEYGSYETGTRVAPGTASLQAGATYSFATFCITNSGALPAELRDGYPARFKLAAPPVALSMVRYFRTVPVGGLETCDAKGNPLLNSANLLPTIPANVWPRASDTFTRSSGVGITQPSSSEAHPPLLMLTQQNTAHPPAILSSQSLEFSLRLPIVDIQTWDITDGYHADPDVRDQVLDISYKLRAKKLRAPITDPLIQKVDFVLYRWLDSNWGDPSAPVAYQRAALTDHATELPTVQTVPIGVEVRGGVEGSNGSVMLSNPNILDAAGNAVRNLVQTTGGVPYPLVAGEVYLMESRLYLNLDSPAGNPRMPRYAPGRALPADPSVPPGTVPSPCMAGYQMLIEIASTEMPKDLITPLELQLVSASGLPDQQLRCRLKADTSAWRNVHRVDFLRQMWSWTGRTQPSGNSIDPLNPGDLMQPQFFPSDQAANLDGLVPAAWEAIEFAERPPADHIESLATFKLATATDPAAFEFTLDLSLDPRATYIRVAPRIYSRYQGLFRETSWSVLSTINGSLENVLWRRIFVRSRARTLKIPRLKALLPLTESAFGSYGCPGILAVFDGPAYDQAGLAERLMVDYATVIDPDLSVTAVWAQTGPDLLGSTHDPVASPVAQVRPKLVVVGPIGHTDDSLSGLEHKFLSHSYIIRPDEAASGKDLSWWFAELRFQMSIDPASTVFSQTIASEQVLGSWIQFLPGFQNGTQSDLFDDWHFSVDLPVAPRTRPDGLPAGGQIFTLFKGKDVQKPGTSLHLGQFLMVERVTLDIAGIQRQDYFGIAIASGDGYVLLDGSDWSSVSEVQVRMLKMRADMPAASFDHHADFWQAVVGGASTGLTDQTRMVSVNLSAPIKEGEF